MIEVKLFKFTKAFYYGTASIVSQQKRRNHYIPKGRHSVSTPGCSEIIAVITILMSAFYTLPKDLHISPTPSHYQLLRNGSRLCLYDMMANAPRYTCQL